MAQAKQILGLEKDGKFCLNTENLNSILLEDEGIRDKPVVLISVAGAFRKGKSFLLDMMLRYLTAPDKTDWLGHHHSKESKGFPWQCGYRRHTTGILMWSQPFPMTLPSGEEVVLLLMDTQGTFDNQSTVHESSMVFALSTLLSSLQIFNLMGNLQSDDLEHLQLFTEYGRMVLEEENGATPFQNLLFLIRDWQYPDDLPLGKRGGGQLVDEWLQSRSEKKELAKVRKHIRDCFKEISGFLLPHPGPIVAGSKKFEGAVEDMDPQFVDGLKQLIPLILAPGNVGIKTIAGNSLKARDLASFMAMYVDLFKSDSLPKPKNILNATAEANNMAAAHDAKNQYIKQMESILGAGKHSLEANELFRHHKQATLQAETAFKSRKKMGSRKMSETFLTKLMTEMEEWFAFAERVNNMKREKERLDAENKNMELVGKCMKSYTEQMEGVSGEDVGHVPIDEMEQAHGNAKSNALQLFDTNKTEFNDIAAQSRYTLAEAINNEFKQMLLHNGIKKDAKNQKAARQNMKAVGQAKRSYQSMMQVMMSDQVVPASQLEDMHHKAVQSAVEMFESIKEGDEEVCLAYLESMKNDIDREFSIYVRSNDNNVAMHAMKAKIKELSQEVQEAKKKPKCVIQ